MHNTRNMSNITTYHKSEKDYYNYRLDTYGQNKSIQKEIANFGKRVEKMFCFIPQLFDEEKPKKYIKLLERIKKYEEITDNIEDEIAAYLSKMLEGEMSNESSRKIMAMLAIIDNLESNADVIYQISRVIDQNHQRKIKIPEETESVLIKDN